MIVKIWVKFDNVETLINNNGSCLLNPKINYN